MDIRSFYLARAKGAQHTAAAAELAFDLMQDDPANFKQGYTFDNAILAALDVFETVSQAEVEHATRRLLGKAIVKRQSETTPPPGPIGYAQDEAGWKRESKVGTTCECGAPYDAEFGGYTCAK